MAGAYSQDLRKRLITTIEALPDSSLPFEVSVSRVVNWRRRWLDIGTAAAKPERSEASVSRVVLFNLRVEVTKFASCVIPQSLARPLIPSSRLK
jgi:hypothetical protein